VLGVKFIAQLLFLGFALLQHGIRSCHTKNQIRANATSTKQATTATARAANGQRPGSRGRASAVHRARSFAAPGDGARPLGGSRSVVGIRQRDLLGIERKAAAAVSLLV